MPVLDIKSVRDKLKWHPTADIREPHLSESEQKHDLLTRPHISFDYFNLISSVAVRSAHMLYFTHATEAHFDIIKGEILKLKVEEKSEDVYDAAQEDFFTALTSYLLYDSL